jgi:uncharacterized protein GlcG (DUF336 family)
MLEHWLFGVAATEIHALSRARMELAGAVSSIRRNPMTGNLGFRKVLTLLVTKKVQWLVSRVSTAIALATCVAIAATTASAQGVSNNCASLPGNSALKNALTQAVIAETSGLNLNMWATVVARDGTVCAVAFSGTTSGSQWLGSRVISAQKASTANFFSLDGTSASNSSGAANGLALSTANLYSAVQPGGSLFGLQESNPVDTSSAYGGSSGSYGTANDPMVGDKIGGINVFGGGLALYTGTSEKHLVGGLGVSGDTSCADHMIAWRVRSILGLDHLAGVGGVSGDPNRPDNIVYDIKDNPQGGTGKSAGGFGHPSCINTGDPASLPEVQ